MKIRVGVIGAGPGGLAAAALLARRGFRVTVFERNPRAGGRNGALQAGGYTFDIGPTFFTMPFVLEEIFQECGRRVDDYVEWKPVDPLCRFVFADGTEYRPGRGPESVRAAVRGINPEDVSGFDRYMEYQRRKTDAVLPCLRVPHEHLYQSLRPSLLKSLPFLNVAGSLWEEVSRFFKDDRLRLAFSLESRYLGMSPFQTPSLFSVLAYAEYRWGVHHPVGGCRRLSAALERLAWEMGARVHLNADVVEIGVEGRSARALRTADGKLHPFDEIVLSADFAWGARNLLPNAARRRHTDEKLARKIYSPSAFVLRLGLDRRYDRLPHHSVFVAKDYRSNLRDIETGERLSDDPTFYVHNPCGTDPTLAPEGHSTLQVHVPAPNTRAGIDWNREKEGYRRLVLKKLAERAGLDDLEEHVRFEEMVTPADWETKARVAHGAIFSLSHTWNQILAFRPHNRSEDLDNLWLAGGGTHPGSGLPLVFQSARITAEGIARKYSGRPAPVAPLAIPLPRISAAEA